MVNGAETLGGQDWPVSLLAHRRNVWASEQQEPIGECPLNDSVVAWQPLSQEALPSCRGVNARRSERRVKTVSKV